MYNYTHLVEFWKFIHGKLNLKLFGFASCKTTF